MRLISTARLGRLLFTALLLGSGSERALSQQQGAGQLVVPHGWENQDSIRIGLFNLQSLYESLGGPKVDTNTPEKKVIASLADSLEHRFCLVASR